MGVTAKKSKESAAHMRRRLKEWIDSNYTFRIGSGDVLYHYDAASGVFVGDPKDTWFRNILYKAIVECGFDTGVFSPQLLSAMSLMVKIGKEPLPETPPDGIACVLNGVVRLDDGSMESHSPGFNCTSVLPVWYEQGAKCPEWDRFMASILDEDCIDTAWEVIGSCLAPDNFIQEMIWLIGSGSNGKSMFIEAMTLLLNKENVQTARCQDFERDRFALAELYHKALYIDPDASSSAVKDSSYLKKIISRDILFAQRKNEHPFTFRPYCRVVFSSNNMPNIADASEAMMRRITPMVFERVFKPGMPGYVPADVLLKRLSQPHELSGAFNKAMEGWRRLKRNNAFSKGKSMMEMKETINVIQSPIQAFTEGHVRYSDEALAQGKFITAGEFIDRFGEWAHDNGLRPMSKKEIGGWIRIHYPRVVARVQNVGAGRKSMVYLGLEWIV